ncbi:carbohydrate-binding module family 50 protein [Plicaturopsis crispa FD-325 SS-3]|nr:carbohydrate-binding module family 50 protein [Plicaturopsis crispa FD-325 SS-3]
MFAHAVTAALVALPFVAQFASAADCARTYTVKEGDICDSISAAKNVSTYQLAVVNYPSVDSACGNLTPGNSICLGWANQDCSTTYVVKPDDDCPGITQLAGINSTLLTQNNPQINQDCSNLYVGEVLCTAKQVQVPALPKGMALPGSTVPTTAAPAQPSATADEDLPYCDEL